MRKIAIAAGVAALLCVRVMAEPAQVDYESMTLEEVKALVRLRGQRLLQGANDDRIGAAKEAKGLLSSALEERYPGQTISGPLFGFDVNASARFTRLTARLQPSWKTENHAYGTRRV